MDTRIADREVEDRFIDLSPAETASYEAVDDYIATTYRNAAADVRNVVGFVMTVYRRRLASSFHALGQTLSKRAGCAGPGRAELPGVEEDVSDDETGDYIQDEEACDQRRGNQQGEYIRDRGSDILPNPL